MTGAHDVVSIGYKVPLQDLLLPDALLTSRTVNETMRKCECSSMSVKWPYLTWRRNCSGPDLRDTACVHGSGLARSTVTVTHAHGMHDPHTHYCISWIGKIQLLRKSKGRDMRNKVCKRDFSNMPTLS